MSEKSQRKSRWSSGSCRPQMVAAAAPAAAARLRRAERLEDLAVLWKAAGLMLRVDQFPVRQNVELALAPRDRLRVEPLARQLGRETRSPRVVAASGRAVVDLDVHPESLARGDSAANAVERVEQGLP